MTEQTSLLDDPALARSEKDRWIERVRAELLRRYGGDRRGVTTDQVWHLSEHVSGLAKPPSVHSNALGVFFAGWDAAEPMMVGQPPHRMQLMRPSVRPKANGNLLRVWYLRSDS